MRCQVLLSRNDTWTFCAYSAALRLRPSELERCQCQCRPADPRVLRVNPPSASVSATPETSTSSPLMPYYCNRDLGLHSDSEPERRHWISICLRSTRRSRSRRSFSSCCLASIALVLPPHTPMSRSLQHRALRPVILVARRVGGQQPRDWIRARCMPVPNVASPSELRPGLTILHFPSPKM